MEVKEFVIGFLFRKPFDEEQVALILKTHPDWQKGKLNGIGGHIEQGETPYQAMRREADEEAGVDSPRWEEYCIVTFPEAILHIFRLFGNYDTKSLTDEVVSWYPVEHLPDNLVHNNYWLIPLALHSDATMRKIALPGQGEVQPTLLDSDYHCFQLRYQGGFFTLPAGSQVISIVKEKIDHITWNVVTAIIPKTCFNKLPSYYQNDLKLF